MYESQALALKTKLKKKLILTKTSWIDVGEKITPKIAQICSAN